MTYYLRSKMGDLIYALSVVKPGSTLIHGMSEESHEFMKPLFNHCGVDLRMEKYGIPEGFINLEPFRDKPTLFTQHMVTTMDGDVSRPWIDMRETTKAHVVINVTTRYRDKFCNWKREMKYIKNSILTAYFIGYRSEYKDFVDRYNAGFVKFVEFNDLMEAARLIASSVYFYGNQSMVLALAQALGAYTIIERAPHHGMACITGRQNERVINPISRKIHMVTGNIKTTIKKCFEK